MMNKFLIAFTIAISVLACQQVETNGVVEEGLNETELFSFNDTVQENFETSFEINNQSDLMVTINPKEGFYFASPQSTGSSVGIADVVLDTNDFIDIFSVFDVELPADFSLNSDSPNDMIWVHQKETYKYQIVMKSSEDFEVEGTLSFVIEPECVRYEIKFFLNQTSGELNVEKGATFQNNLNYD